MDTCPSIVYVNLWDIQREKTTILHGVFRCPAGGYGSLKGDTKGCFTLKQIGKDNMRFVLIYKKAIDIEVLSRAIGSQALSGTL